MSNHTNIFGFLLFVAEEQKSAYDINNVIAEQSSPHTPTQVNMGLAKVGCNVSLQTILLFLFLRFLQEINFRLSMQGH